MINNINFQALSELLWSIAVFFEFSIPTRELWSLDSAMPARKPPYRYLYSKTGFKAVNAFREQFYPFSFLFFAYAKNNVSSKRGVLLAIGLNKKTRASGIK